MITSEELAYVAGNHWPDREQKLTARLERLIGGSISVEHADDPD